MTTRVEPVGGVPGDVPAAEQVRVPEVARIPQEAHSPAAAEGRRRLYIWQLPVRFTHWLTAG